MHRFIFLQSNYVDRKKANCPSAVTCNDLKWLFKAKIYFIDTKNLGLVFSTSDVTIWIYFLVNMLKTLFQLILQHSGHVYCINSVASIIAGKHQENERFSVGVCGHHRLNRGLELNVCAVQCIKAFPVFYLLYH